MTVIYTYIIAIAASSEWLKNPTPVFQPMRGNTNLTLYIQFFPCFEQVTGNCWDFDWFIALFAHVVTGQSNYLGQLVF